MNIGTILNVEMAYLWDIYCLNGFVIEVKVLLFGTCEILQAKLNTAVVRDHAKISPSIQ